jgi:two-component system, chemotaxis family, protein-glutamate methylesterase/glutaminase
LQQHIICARRFQGRQARGNQTPTSIVFFAKHAAEARVDGFAVVVIGASQGGVEALQKLVAQLEKDLPAAVLITLHVGRGPSHLPALLNRRSRLPASHAEESQEVRPGRIYVAPADHHLIVDGTRMCLSRGPRENWTRPAIDPMFRSAAESFGPRVIGAILTGRLNDGTAGIYAVRRHGGVAVVQHPGTAEFPEMPSSALRYAGADHCVPLAAMPPLLSDLAHKIASSEQARAAVAGGRPHA